MGGTFEAVFAATPGLVWLLIKAWLMFAVFVWIRASLHRVRTDQILEFGWRWLLPLSLVNLVVAIILRLEFWTGQPWELWVPAALSLAALALFVILAIDEDEEALQAQRRPYSTQAVVKASPGSHRD